MEEVASGLWSPEEVDLSIKARELLAVERSFLSFQALLVDSTVSIFVDNATAVAYLRKQGSTHSLTLNAIAQRILCWAEPLRLVFTPQFIMGRHNVLADSLACPNQILGSEWTLKMEVFRDLRRRWPVMVDLFATSSNDRCIPYFTPYHDLAALGMEALLQDWDGLQACAFPPWAVIPLVLRKLRASSGVLMTLVALFWPQRPWFPDLLELGGGRAGSSATLSQSIQTASFPSASSRDPQAVSSCLATVQRFARTEGFSSRVATQVGFARRPSSRTNYQVKWSVYRRWCRVEGHSISRPTLPKVSDFLF